MLTPEQIAKAGSETAHQTALMAQAALHRKQYPQLKWLHAIPNANSHRMVDEGVRGGIPDVCLPLPIHHTYDEQYGIRLAGLYIEMKVERRRKHKNGGLSDEQVECIAYLREVGYYVAVCYSWIEAWKVIEDYLNGRL